MRFVVATCLLFVAVNSAPLERREAKGDTLRVGERLYHDDALMSQNGKYRAEMQTDGNFVVRKNGGGGALWSSDTHKTGATEVVLQGDGNLVIYSATPRDSKWSSGTHGESASHLVMQDDGNLVLKGTDGRTLWGTNTGESTSVSKGALFDNGRTVGKVTSTREASGLAASRRHPDVMYALDDSGGKPALYVISAKDGRSLATITISGVSNKDWEDLAVGPCGDDRGGYCIYIGDVGGNVGSPKEEVYKVREPSSIRSQNLPVDSTFRIDWDAPNCEALMVDEKGEVYLISKVSGNAKLYQLPKSGWGRSSRQQVPSIGRLTTVTGALVASDISPNGQEILVKAYKRMYYWKRKDGESVRDALARQPVEVPYRPEPQGETVAWSYHGDGYYTLSERTNQPLWYFERA